jgi:hypothetical protein
MTDETVSDGPVSDRSISDEPGIAPRSRFWWVSTAVAVVFGLFYVYDLWNAVGSLLELPKLYVAYGLTRADVPWWLLIVDVAIPAVAFVVAYFLGRHHSLGGKALLYFVGLAAVSCLSLSSYAIEAAIRVSLLTGGLGS